jgi:hypothetical protein
MKTNKKSQVNNKNAKSARNDGKGGKKTAQGASKAASQNARWNFKLDKVGYGPFQLGGLSMGSDRAARSTAMVGLGQYATPIQRRQPRWRSEVRTGGEQVEILTGTDRIGAVSSSEAGNLAGDLLFTQRIQPKMFEQTRLEQIAPLYQRYRFKRVSFIYEPTANATQGGQLLGFCDFDADSVIIENSPANLQRAAAHEGQAVTQIWQKQVFSMGQSPSFTDLFTDTNGDDPRLFIQGVFYLMAGTDLPAGIPLGTIYVDYEIEFTIPQLGNTTTAVHAGVVRYTSVDAQLMPGSSPAAMRVTFGQLEPTQSLGDLNFYLSDLNRTLHFDANVGDDIQITSWVRIQATATITQEMVSGASLDYLSGNLTGNTVLSILELDTSQTNNGTGPGAIISMCWAFRGTARGRDCYISPLLLSGSLPNSADDWTSAGTSTWSIVRRQQVTTKSIVSRKALARQVTDLGDTVRVLQKELELVREYHARVNLEEEREERLPSKAKASPAIRRL